MIKSTDDKINNAIDALMELQANGCEFSEIRSLLRKLNAEKAKELINWIDEKK